MRRRERQVLISLGGNDRFNELVAGATTVSALR
jgi:hypothetical protein